MTTYKTPGVYIEEIPKLPPSVAEVSTAIPAFIGCTENGPDAITDEQTNEKHVTPIVMRIDTLLDYETLFGGPCASSFTVQATEVEKSKWQLETIARTAPTFDYLLYNSLSLYFKNGGGSCYIVSIGNYKDTPTKTQFEDGLAALAKEDEPTLILLTDAIHLNSVDYYDLVQQALMQCDELGDRFVILDVPESESVANFRTGIGNNYLMYGAAYYPHLKTSLIYAYGDTNVTVNLEALPASPSSAGITPGGSTSPDAAPSGSDSTVSSSTDTPPAGSDSTESPSTDTPPAESTTTDLAPAATTVTETASTETATTDIVPAGPSSLVLNVLNQPGSNLVPNPAYNTALYNQIKSALAQQRVTLPPSAAIAGIYASVDRSRGVWKAPANVSLSAVIGPTIKITHQDQEDLNIDPTAGKSINAIRAFTGKGTLVWGARTLAGNDNEWRYVSVRRLFNMIEESAQKATAFAVFEPNDATTWLKVKAMIESYLYGLWQQGALAGSTPEQAYFVNVGLGKTMTAQDILEGRMIVEIGLAAVRPAEFIILRFMHKLQQA